MKVIPQSIPSTEVVGDQALRNILMSMRTNLHAAFGIDGDKTKRFVTASDLQTAGLANVDSNGKVTQKVLPSSSASSSSSGSSARISLSANVSMAGWVVGANYINLSIPIYAVVMNGWYYVSIAAESATNAATIQLGVESDSTAGLLLAAAITSDFTVGSHGLITDGVAANFLIPTTGYRSIVATVANEPLTAGEMTFCIEYFIK